MKYKKYKCDYWGLGLLCGFMGCFILSWAMVFDFKMFFVLLFTSVCFLLFGKYGGQLMLEDELYIRVKTE